MTGFGPYPRDTYPGTEPQPCSGRRTPYMRRCNAPSRWELWAHPCGCWVTSCRSHLDQLLDTITYHSCDMKRPAYIGPPGDSNARTIAVNRAWEVLPTTAPERLRRIAAAAMITGDLPERLRRIAAARELLQCGYRWDPFSYGGTSVHNCERPKGHTGPHRCPCNEHTPQEVTTPD